MRGLLGHIGGAQAPYEGFLVGLGLPYRGAQNPATGSKTTLVACHRREQYHGVTAPKV